MEKYISPEIEVIRFSAEDVIVASGNETDGVSLNGGGSGSNTTDGVPIIEDTPPITLPFDPF